MKLINPSAELYLQEDYTLEGIYKQIERCSRISYKSENKITENSSKDFVDRLIKSGHLSTLEHGTVYLLFLSNCYDHLNQRFLDQCYENPYTKVVGIGSDDDMLNPEDVNSKNAGPIYLGDTFNVGVRGDHLYAITTNYRTIIENHWEDCLQYLCAPTEYHEKRLSIKFTTSRGISHEIVRHRSMSFIQESQRYCNYSKDKFNNELTFIIPSWLDVKDNTTVPTPQYLHKDYTTTIMNATRLTDLNSIDFVDALLHSESVYLSLIKGDSSGNKLLPQEARDVLLNATKTEIVVTGFELDWKKFFDLRLRGTTGKPHSDMVKIAQIAWDKLKEIGYEL